MFILKKHWRRPQRSRSASQSAFLPPHLRIVKTRAQIVQIASLCDAAYWRQFDTINKQRFLTAPFVITTRRNLAESCMSRRVQVQQEGHLCESTTRSWRRAVFSWANEALMDQGRIRTDPLPVCVPSQWDNDAIHQVDLSHTHVDASPGLCYYASDIRLSNYLSCSLRNWVKCSFRIQDAGHLVNPKKRAICFHDLAVR